MYTVIPTQKFEDDLKFYKRKRNYRHIEDDIDPIISEIEQGNFVGDEIPNLQVSADGHTYKVRAANTDAKVGKSNGYRIIYYVVRDDEEVYLLTIYSKKDDKNIPSSAEIVQLISQYCMDNT